MPAPRLKMLQVSGAGYDGVDVEEATRRGILCCNNADTNSGRTADFAMMATLNLLRSHIATVNAMQGGRNWESARLEGIEALEVAGKTRKLALRVRAFDMDILFCDTDPKAHQATAKRTGARRVCRDELCRRADVISVHVPLDGTTRHLLGGREFALMKAGVFIVCTARGGIIEEAALRRAPDSGKVAGAAMDVFSEDTIRPDNPLIGARNLYPTPHVASRGKEGVLRSFQAGIANIRRFIETGRRPANILNPQVRAVPARASGAVKKSAAHGKSRRSSSRTARGARKVTR